MVSSQNKKVEFSCDATSFMGLSTYGKLMLGDVALEFYNDRNVNDFIQIPWSEITCVYASVIMRGKYIPRFLIVTQSSGKYSFSTRDNKHVLRVIRSHIGEEKMLKSPSFLDIVRLGVTRLIGKK